VAVKMEMSETSKKYLEKRHQNPKTVFLGSGGWGPFSARGEKKGIGQSSPSKEKISEEKTTEGRKGEIG